MVFYILFYLCFLISFQQEIPYLIKIFNNKSSSTYFYINSSFSKDNSIILPLKIELNSQTTSIFCEKLPKLEEKRPITCSDNICYKLFFDEEKCYKSLDNKCSFISLYKYDFDNYKNISGIYIQHYFNLFINDKNAINKNNILPIGCIENNFNFINENFNSGILALGGEIYSFLPHYYKENGYKENNSYFSICLDPEEGGYLTIGNLTDQYHLNNDLPISFKYDIKNSYYLLTINNMFFNHDSFNKEEYNAILNMDIEYTYVNKKIINNLYNLFKQYLTTNLLKKYQLDITISNKNINSDSYGICFINNNINDIQFKEKLFTIFPPLFIGFGNKYYKWNSEYYLYKNNNNNQEYCIGLLSNEKRNKNEDIIELGLNFMYGHELIFNFTKKEILVYESNCSMKQKKKIDIKLESKYNTINGYLKYIIIFLVILIIFLVFIICRISKRKTTLCSKCFGKKVTNEEINLFFNSNYNIIK